MSIFKKIISSLGILCLMNCSNQNEEQDKIDLLKWIEHQVGQITANIEKDIEKEKQGFYPHAGKPQYSSLGYINYVLQEKDSTRLELSENDIMRLEDIASMVAFQALKLKVEALGYNVDLSEATIDGDEVETADELDEYIDDILHYYQIRISGW